jgi:pantetheine-phosphate adenylyltransferase
MSKRVALFAGSFDPYTNGHHDIVRKAAALFDEVVILIGVNVNKRRAFDAEPMRKAIQAAVDADGLNARTVIHNGLVADYCAAHGIRWYVRGLRNNMDYNYEENLAQINHLINPALESIYLRSDDPAISSSMIRELMAFGKPAAAFVPAPVAALLRQ